MKYKDENGNWVSIALPAFDGLPIGIIIEYAGSVLPKGYLYCDGSAISRTTYSDLFAIIGTTYGAGDGSTTFNLPDFKSRIGVGIDSNDTDFDTLGKTGGSKELQQHRHQSVYGSSFGSGDLDEHTYEDVGFVANGTAIAGAAYYNTRYEGTGNSGNVQPYVVVNYIIKASQTTPTSAQIIDEYGTSTTDGYSQKFLNDKIDGYVLYENSSGTTSDILIQNHQFSDYKYLEIYTQLGVFKVFKTGYNTISGVVYSDTLYLSYLEFNVIAASNSININVSRSGTYFMGENHSESFKTYKVIGYK